MYMTPQQVLAQYYQNQQQGQSMQPQGAMQGYGGAPIGNAPAPGAGATGAQPAGLSPANYGMANRFNIPIQPQVNALAQQMQANKALQQQIGYNGAPITAGYGAMPPQPTPQQALPMQNQPGMASAAPQPMPGGTAGTMTPQQPQWRNPGMGSMGGAANRLAQYYMR